jgi:uncharacterized membrane protein YbhN (UPF0104 family)
LAMRLVGPLLLVWVLWRFADFEALAATFKRASVWPLVAAVLLDAGVIHAKLVRWQSLLAACKVRVDTAAAYRAYLPSLFLGLATPGRVGDVVRIQYLKRDHGVRYSDGLAVSVVDRLCDVYVLLAFVSLGIVHLTSALSAPLARTAWIAVAGVAVAPLLLFMPKVAEPAANWLYARLAGDAASDGPAVFFEALRSQMGRALVVPLGATVAAFLINYLQACLVASALGLNLSFADVVAVVSISSLLGLLPISVSGVGVREAFCALIFPVAFGLSETMGIAFGLGVFGVIYLPALAVGFAAWQAWPPSR